MQPDNFLDKARAFAVGVWCDWQIVITGFLLIGIVAVCAKLFT